MFSMECPSSSVENINWGVLLCFFFLLLMSCCDKANTFGSETCVVVGQCFTSPKFENIL